RRRHTRFSRDWSSDVCSSDLGHEPGVSNRELPGHAVDERQADGQRDVDARQADDARVIRVDAEVAEAVFEQLVEYGKCDDGQGRWEERRAGRVGGGEWVSEGW